VIFTQTRLPGAYVIEPERRADERGFFARTWCREEFLAHGLSAELAQCNVSWNRLRGTFRGLHYQEPPHAECKLVRCTRGAIYDVLLDLRPDSPQFCCWQGFELAAEHCLQLYVPMGVAHGFLTLSDESEVFYQMSRAHHAGASAGVRHDDPAFGISLPEPVRSISRRDREFPDFSATQFAKAH
jgi:dTDP-4-dehydrorhamnose 3,5-epimerase